MYGDISRDLVLDRRPTEEAIDELAPPFAFSYLPYRVERETTVTRSDLEDGRLPDVFWILFLSEPVCERLGRNRLQTSPVWKTESLPDGGVGIVVTADPYQYSEEEKNHFKDHLGI